MLYAGRSIVGPAIRAILAVAALLLAASAALAQEEGGAGEIDWVTFAMGALGGLILFLYGVDLLAKALREGQDDRLKEWLRRGSINRLAALGSGTAATVVLDSSSVTIILLIAIVDAGLMPFASALPMILGSNIGTTISSQVFAWSIDAYAPLLMAAGLLWRVLVKDAAGRRWAMILFGIGLVLFGLGVIGTAAEPLQDDPRILAWLRELENPLYGVLAGAAVTVAIQSSSAMMGIVIALAGGGLVTLPAGVAIMLGAEIGTCADTLVATLGRSRAAVKAGVFHLLFNVASVIIGVLLIGQLTWFGEATATDTGQRIANAHVMFNVLGALAVLPFVGIAARLLDGAIPDQASAGSEPAPAGGEVTAV